MAEKETKQLCIIDTGHNSIIKTEQESIIRTGYNTKLKVYPGTPIQYTNAEEDIWKAIVADADLYCIAKGDIYTPINAERLKTLRLFKQLES